MALLANTKQLSYSRSYYQFYEAEVNQTDVSIKSLTFRTKPYQRTIQLPLYFNTFIITMLMIHKKSKWE